MRSVGEHLNLCLLAVGPLPPLAVNLEDAWGCVLAQDLVAPITLPPQDLAACDGYAVRLADLDELAQNLPPLPEPEPGAAGASGNKNNTNAIKLPVTAEVLAGESTPLRLVEGTAIKIASGAPLPLGANAVVASELTDRGEAQVTIFAPPSPLRPGHQILRAGEDVQEGQTVLRKGTRVGAGQIALAAALGQATLAVNPRPRVVVLSIGDELVEPGLHREPGQLFDANGQALISAARELGAATFRPAAVSDERGALREALQDQLVRADLVITTGGLSGGSADTVKEVLAPLGTVRFDNVAISPGRQLGVGTIGRHPTGGQDTADIAQELSHIPIFCLPGNPVAAQVAFEVFVRPALRKMAGWSDLYRPSVQATMESAWACEAGRRQFVPVQLRGGAQGYQARPVADPDQLSISSLSRANAFAVVPEDVTHVAAGSRLHCMVLEG